MSLFRRTPLKRTGLARSNKPMARSKLKPVSQRQRQVMGRRTARRREALESGERCCLEGYAFPCAGLLVHHELVRRSQWAAGADDPLVQVLICGAHHEIDSTSPHTAAYIGLRVWSWEWDHARKYGTEHALLQEKAALREQARTNQGEN